MRPTHPSLHALALIAAFSILTPPIAEVTAQVRIDGTFQDWPREAALVTDPVDGTDGSADLVRVSADGDEEFVYLMLEMATPLNLQGLGPSHMTIGFDADGNPQTGETALDMEGTDLLIHFSPPYPNAPDAPGAGVSVQLLPPPPLVIISPYTLDLAFAPTFASREVEIRIRRQKPVHSHPALFAHDHFRARIVVQSAGKTVDETPIFTQTLKPACFPLPPARQPMSSPMEKAPESRRVLSWNTEYASLFENPEPFARVLQYLDPDVVLLQELTEQVTREQIEAWFHDHLPGTNDHPWQIAFQSLPGRLSPAIASRFPLDPAPPAGFPLANPHPGFLATIATIDAQPVLLGSIHLPCCGYLDSRKDNNRKREATAISEWLQSLLVESPPAAIIMGGDLNLVGGYTPLDILISENDLDGSDLAYPHPFQPDGRWDYTWADPSQPFTPGRLDFVVHSNSTLRCVQAFVFDSTKLSPETLQQSGIHADDSTNASDHLPVVQDYQWIGSQQDGLVTTK